jgi:hypothetical protein
MAGNAFVVHGLEELMAALEAAPEALLRTATAIVDEETEATAVALKAAYPTTGTGKMASGVITRVAASTDGVVGTVESLTPEAVWWEFGTQDRRTRAGWYRGRAPHHRPEGLIPIAARHRRRMVERVVAAVEAAGFTVHGEI